MKIRFLKNITVDVEDPRLEESWSREIPRWKELLVEEIFTGDEHHTFKTMEGEYLLHVPSDSFEKLQERSKIEL